MSYCEYCGRQIRDEARFCPYCSKSTTLHPATAGQRRFCRRCGKPYPGGSFQCASCGYSAGPVGGAATHRQSGGAASGQSFGGAPRRAPVAKKARHLETSELILGALLAVIIAVSVGGYLFLTVRDGALSKGRSNTASSAVTTRTAAVTANATLSAEETAIAQLGEAELVHLIFYCEDAGKVMQGAAVTLTDASGKVVVQGQNAKQSASALEFEHWRTLNDRAELTYHVYLPAGVYSADIEIEGYAPVHVDNLNAAQNYNAAIAVVSPDGSGAYWYFDLSPQSANGVIAMPDPDAGSEDDSVNWFFVESDGAEESRDVSRVADNFGAEPVDQAELPAFAAVTAAATATQAPVDGGVLDDFWWVTVAPAQQTDDIWQDYATAAPQQTAASRSGTVRIRNSGERTNIRSGPGLSYSVLGVLSSGSSLTWLGESSTDNRGVAWYKVSYGGGTGWVSEKYTVLKKD